MNKLLIILCIVGGVSLLGYLGVIIQGTFDHKNIMNRIVENEKTDLHYDIEIDTALFVKIHSEVDELATFFTEKRQHTITSFPCQNCHNISLDRMAATYQKDRRNAHWDVHLHHAGSSVMNCFTCHKRNDMNQLVSLTGKPISIDRSYELCGQCHTPQYKDWLGGAHGKKISGWKPPRISKTCVSCHPPHEPAIPSQWPSRWIDRNAKSPESNH